MTIIRRQVGTARQRIMANVLFAQLAFGLLVGAGVWAAATILQRLLLHGLPELLPVWLAAATASIVTLVGLYVRRIDAMAAAITIDGLASLRERLSTALAVEGSRDPFAQAAIVDAQKAAGGLRVADHLRYRAPELWPWSLAAMLSAALLFAFLPQVRLFASEQQEDPAQARAAVKESTDVTAKVNEQLDKVRKLTADNPKLANLAGKIEPLQMPEKASAKPDDVRREALKKIDSIRDQIEKQADVEKLDALKALEKELAKLKSEKGDSPSDKLSQALAGGDMKAAEKAVADLKKQIDEAAAKPQSPEARQKLEEAAKKLDQLSEQMKKLAENQKQQAQKDLENLANLTPEQAKELAEKLAQMDKKQLQEALKEALKDSNLSPQQMQQLAQKLQQQQENKKQCDKMGECMKQAAQAMKAQCQQGQDGKSSEDAAQAGQAALAEAMQKLSEMDEASQEAQDMQQALDELKKLRDGVCQKQGDEPGDQGPKEGLGYGSRIGKEKAGHKYQADKAKTKLTEGEIIGQMLIDGPQIRGEASAAVRDAVNSAVRDAQDAVDRQDVPRQYQNAVAAYFKRLAGLMPGAPNRAPAKEPPAKAPGDEGEGNE